MNKAQLTEKLHDFFASQPGVTLSFKEIFRALHLDTHPLKMLAIDIMEEMAWDDYLAKVSDNSYRLNQSIHGKFFQRNLYIIQTIKGFFADRVGPLFPVPEFLLFLLGKGSLTTCILCHNKDGIHENNKYE